MAWKPVMDSVALSEGQGQEIVHQGDVIAIFRHQGGLHAIDGVCIHQGGPLAKGKLCDGTIQCPWHGWTYELATGKNAVTCQMMLKTYPIREIDGKIEIDVPG